MAEIISMPKLGFDMAEGTLVRWVIGQGESVEKGQVLAEIETDKATVEVESSASGILHSHLVKEGDIVPVGTPIAVVATPGEEVADLPSGVTAIARPPDKAGTSAVEAVVQESVQEVVASEDGERLKASPLARRMARLPASV